MKRIGESWLLVGCVAATLAGCGSSTVSHMSGSGGSNSTGSGGSSGDGSGGSSGSGFMEVALTVTDSGWVGALSDGSNDNSLGIHGSWYPYGDQYGPLCGPTDMPNSSSGMKCNDPHFGNHPTSDCSVITTPDPTVMSFPNTDGKMCTSGMIAKVIAIVNSSQGTGMDYSNIWGAGIGLDLEADMGSTACDTKGVFNAKDKHVVGVKFDLSSDSGSIPPAGLRVEFPTPTTDGTKNGSAYWGADSSFSTASGKYVVVGTNTIFFDPLTVLGSTAGAKDPTMPQTEPVVVPGSSPGMPLDQTAIESIQFHVPASTSASTMYQFCISNLKMLVQQ